MASTTFKASKIRCKVFVSIYIGIAECIERNIHKHFDSNLNSIFIANTDMCIDEVLMILFSILLVYSL